MSMSTVQSHEYVCIYEHARACVCVWCQFISEDRKRSERIKKKSRETIKQSDARLKREQRVTEVLPISEVTDKVRVVHLELLCRRVLSKIFGRPDKFITSRDRKRYKIPSSSDLQLPLFSIY